MYRRWTLEGGEMCSYVGGVLLSVSLPQQIHHTPHRQKLSLLSFALSPLFRSLSLFCPGVNIMEMLEAIHWLALITGHFLADKGDGEIPQIPPTINELSKSFQGQGVCW